MMNMSAWVAIAISLIIAIIGHIVASVWWASRVTAVLDIVQRDLKQGLMNLEKFKDQCFTKGDAQRELTIAEKEHKALWRRVDETRDKLEALK